MFNYLCVITVAVKCFLIPMGIFFFTFIREWSIEDREVPAPQLLEYFFILIEKNIRIVYLELQKVNLLISAL